MKIVIATIKSWNINKSNLFAKDSKHDVRVVTSTVEFNNFDFNSFSPDYVFFPHWSEYIPKEIYTNYKCVVFHMTDLPYGRGGSPLQNLIERGFSETKISAIKVTENFDAGPIYTKSNLSLEGSATEIFRRAADIIFDEMIPKILSGLCNLTPQVGEATVFLRRKPEESELYSTMNLGKAYDYIRMLDAEGYPRAFIRMGKLRFEFQEAIKEGNMVIAKTIITEENNE